MVERKPSSKFCSKNIEKLEEWLDLSEREGSKIN